MYFEEIKKQARDILSEKRFVHTMGVVTQIEKLVSIYGGDIEKARLVAISHDIAKEMNLEEMLEYVKENDIEIDEIEKGSPNLLHGKIAANIMKQKYNFDEEMQEAIENHTTGKENLSHLGKLLYIADVTEDSRGDNNPNFILARKMVENRTDLNELLLFCIDIKIRYLLEKRAMIHINSIYFRNDILKQYKEEF